MLLRFGRAMPHVWDDLLGNLLSNRTRCKAHRIAEYARPVIAGSCGRSLRFPESEELLTSSIQRAHFIPPHVISSIFDA
eukprot:scaffold47869_cov29-Tisochrysis_lutea.AAC.3